MSWHGARNAPVTSPACARTAPTLGNRPAGSPAKEAAALCFTRPEPSTQQNRSLAIFRRKSRRRLTTRSFERLKPQDLQARQPEQLKVRACSEPSGAEMVRSWHSRTAWRCGFCHKVVKRIPEVFVWRSRYAQASTLLPAFVQEETPNLKLEQFEPVKDLRWGTI